MFIELTSRITDLKFLLKLDDILSVNEYQNGGAYIETSLINNGEYVEFQESYEEVKRKINEINIK